MKWLPPVLAVALLSSQASAAALKTIEWLNGLDCRSSIKFDPRKYDEQKLRNTVDVIFAGGSIGAPFPDILPDILLHPKSPVSERLEQYQQLCEATIRRASELTVINLLGIEAYRKQKLEELDDECKLGTVEVRAAAGEPSALRNYAPSAEKCSRFVDALEGKVDLKTFWREMVVSTCKGNAWPDKCRASHFSHEEGADAMDWVRYEVLGYGWRHCSVDYIKTNVDQKRSEEMRAALEREFGRRFRVKSEQCSD